jgi:hypothetical protein
MSGTYRPTKLGGCRVRAVAPSSLARGTASYCSANVIRMLPGLHDASLFTPEAGSPSCGATKTLTGLCLLMIAVVDDDLVEGLQFAEIRTSVSTTARARRRA